ncbi:MAG: hypothetical protein LBR10_15110 [Prevotellaceae bacterium]|jgi:hypothetical protein|nr:hypothetical protein [Prevotellaceae bacterium]
MIKILKTIQQILSGNSEVRYIMKYYKYLLVLFALTIIYIGNGIKHDLEARKYKKLEEKLIISKAKYNIKLMEMSELTTYSNLMKLLRKNNLNLRTPETSPVKIEK